MEKSFAVKFIAKLPIGFKFVPSDQELIKFYYSRFLENLPQPLNLIDYVNVYEETPDQLSAVHPTYPSDSCLMFFYTPRRAKYTKTCSFVERAVKGGGKWVVSKDEVVYDELNKNTILGYKKLLFYVDPIGTNNNNSPPDKKNEKGIKKAIAKVNESAALKAKQKNETAPPGRKNELGIKKAIAEVNEGVVQKEKQKVMGKENKGVVEKGKQKVTGEEKELVVEKGGKKVTGEQNNGGAEKAKNKGKNKVNGERTWWMAEYRLKKKDEGGKLEDVLVKLWQA